ANPDSVPAEPCCWPARPRAAGAWAIAAATENSDRTRAKYKDLLISKPCYMKTPDDMQRIIIDTDGGIDDALAVLLAFGWPAAQVEAITTVHGNVPVAQATKNLFEVLHIVGRAGLISEGCPNPISATPVFAKD